MSSLNLTLCSLSSLLLLIILRNDYLLKPRHKLQILIQNTLLKSLLLILIYIEVINYISEHLINSSIFFFIFIKSHKSCFHLLIFIIFLFLRNYGSGKSFFSIISLSWNLRKIQRRSLSCINKGSLNHVKIKVFLKIFISALNELFFILKKFVFQRVI